MVGISKDGITLMQVGMCIRWRKAQTARQGGRAVIDLITSNTRPASCFTANHKKGMDGRRRRQKEGYGCLFKR